LRLAAIAREAGASVVIEDFNLLYHLLPELQENFYEAATSRLEALDADVYAFTSMAVDSHVALSLARRLKESDPRRITLFGGPHFSSLAGVLRGRYPWVDHVIAGEGEAQFVEFLRQRLGRPELSVLTQLSEAAMSPKLDYSAVHLPAYFHVNPNRVLDYEVNRGCRYKCTFCYSPNFYASSRDFAVDRIVEDLAGMRDLGARRVFFVGDNFLNHRTWVEQLCSALEDAHLGIEWYCYATLPDLTEDVAVRMGRAGCRQVFLGIDVVGRVSEQHFHKAFMRRESDIERKIRMLRDCGIEDPTCGFILCPPSHLGSADLSTTLAVALHARRAGAQVLFNTLNLYPGTEAYQTQVVRHEADFVQVRLLLDVPPVLHVNPYAGDHPDAFPFHSRYVPAQEWREFLYQAHCLHTLVNSFPNDLLAAWEHSAVTPVDLAKSVLERVGDLLRLPAQERRQQEQNEGLTILADLARRRGAALLGEAHNGDSAGQGFW
jgi:hypothetical protein